MANRKAVFSVLLVSVVLLSMTSMIRPAFAVPRISIQPNQLDLGKPYLVTITGTGFSPDAMVSIFAKGLITDHDGSAGLYAEADGTFTYVLPFAPNEAGTYWVQAMEAWPRPSSTGMEWVLVNGPAPVCPPASTVTTTLVSWSTLTVTEPMWETRYDFRYIYLTQILTTTETQNVTQTVIITVTETVTNSTVTNSTATTLTSSTETTSTPSNSTEVA